MNILIKIAFITVVAISNMQASVDLAENEIRKVSEGRYVGKKSAHYAHENLSNPKHDLYFVFEKFGVNDWRQYNAYQTKGARAKENEHFLRGKKILDGISSFTKSLDLWGRLPYSSTEGWVAYVTTINPLGDVPITFTPGALRMFNKQLIRGKDTSDIEMTFTVFLNPESPITSHIGISRNFEYFRDDARAHKNLAMQLHAFAAQASNLLYGNKLYMVTKPVEKMKDIMAHALSGAENCLWIGDNKERKEQLQHPNPRDCAHFVPLNLTQLSPLENTDDDQWSITPPGGNVMRFDRPDWFNHEHLSNSIPTAIIDIKVLAATW